MILHLVLFQPKAAISVEERERFVAALQRAVTGITQVQRARIGAGVQVGVSYEAKLGRPPYDFAAMLEFASLEDLRIYLNHPLHKALGEMFWETCESTMILDAEVIDAADAELLEFLGQGAPKPDVKA